jgi:hypothetical protein
VIAAQIHKKLHHCHKSIILREYSDEVHMLKAKNLLKAKYPTLFDSPFLLLDLPSRTQEEPIIAWRVWELDFNNLVSIAYGIPWIPGINIASHKFAKQSKCWGFESCHCGFYALNNKDLAYEMALEQTRGPRVLGLVQLWGTIIKHELGYRSTHAKVLALQCGEDLFAYPPMKTYHNNKRSPEVYVLPDGLKVITPQYKERIIPLIRNAGQQYGVPVLSNSSLEIFLKEMGE